ncbi:MULTISPECIES: TIGR01906 family membrane protein [Arthrobacter]|uniref:TIGR01906 family membrane protein n=2 Tax=Arthrobacter TaxID=1663 RepID=A0ABU9KLB7_9MICC|nr:TIGR01906 family membrane protein [Arthrobacter sp. YJM1]MDP5227355.1 TIGR01906 family membrane protein [Arthrobacter sp. YJM1]
MSEKNPNEPEWDAAQDSEEPAFDWMKGAKASGDLPSGDLPSGDSPSGDSPSGDADPDGEASDPRDSGVQSPGEQAPDDDGAAARSPKVPLADDSPQFLADEAPAAGEEGGVPAVAHPEDPAVSGTPTPHQEKLPTSALSLRGPEDEVQRRQAARDAALAAKPVGPRVVKVLSAVFLPLLLLITAVRVVATPLFLWLEYIRPGFPADGYGFSQEDRITYGSYAVDYLSNFSGPRYLGDLVTASGSKLFRDAEISHMADVKAVTMTTWTVGGFLAVLAVIAIWYLGSRRDGSLRHAFFSASIVTLVLILTLGVLGFLGWDRFFTDFHEIFFANGTWTFSLQDTLIRLFPGQFWMDAAATIGGLVFLTALVTLIVTWPTKRRREARKTVIAERLAAQQAAVAGE